MKTSIYDLVVEELEKTIGKKEKQLHKLKRNLASYYDSAECLKTCGSLHGPYDDPTWGDIAARTIYGLFKYRKILMIFGIFLFIKTDILTVFCMGALTLVGFFLAAAIKEIWKNI